MDNNTERIYSKRKRIIKIKKPNKIILISILLVISVLLINHLLNIVTPIIDAKSLSVVKALATQISNTEATIAMEGYEYGDLTNIIRDENGSVIMIDVNIININKIISDIPIRIQTKLDENQKNKFDINLGSFLGNKFFVGTGPNIEINIESVGHVETFLESEFESAGVNQTIHRIYLQVECDMEILTPLSVIKYDIANQVLLSEGIIFGQIPSTYYNLDGLSQSNILDVIE